MKDVSTERERGQKNCLILQTFRAHKMQTRGLVPKIPKFLQASDMNGSLLCVAVIVTVQFSCGSNLNLATAAAVVSAENDNPLPASSIGKAMDASDAASMATPRYSCDER